MKKFYVGPVLVFLSATACAGHHEKADHAATPEAMSMDEQVVMQAMQAAATPGDPHKELAMGVGKYDAQMTFWTGPGSEPMSSTMTVVRSMDLDGRVLVENWSGQVMGAPFKGVGRTGYDNVSKRYWSTWTDNLSTGLLVMYGNVSEDGQSMAFSGKNLNPVTGKEYVTRSVGSLPTSDEEKMTMYEDHGQGEYKAMTFTLTRQ